MKWDQTQSGPRYPVAVRACHRDRNDQIFAAVGSSVVAAGAFRGPGNHQDRL